jgi:hypothetical protein
LPAPGVSSVRRELKGTFVGDYQFERESRTPYSEAYAVDDGGDVIGRVDIHFNSSGMVHATLCVPQDFEEADIEDLIAEIDERLVLTSEPHREDFIVTVWRGVQAGVFSEESGEEDSAEANGASPFG